MKPNSLSVKIGLIAILILLLLIPTVMVQELIHEREERQTSALNEIGSNWGSEQTIVGPVLTIPYDHFISVKENLNTEAKITKQKRFIHILPDDLKIRGKIDPEKRYRGIYEVVVYNSQIKIEGSFSSLNFSKLDINIENVHLNKAFLSLGLSDLKGIEKQIVLTWNKEESFFNPGTRTKDVITRGINSPVSLRKNNDIYNFALNLSLKGSQYLHFTAVGKTTDVQLSSTWTNPSFNGLFLPDKRSVSEKGFDANWNVLHLNRNFPQQWVGSSKNIASSAFGVNLLLPIDRYQKSIRVAKYAILFITLTFLVFFFVEVQHKTFIHPIQYVLVGIALIVFYTLLISISEHLSFNIAYIISSLMTISLIFAYVKAILKVRYMSELIAGILLVLYSFIFVIIQLQDFALLIGSIGVFIILSLVMYFSRKIDWAAINLDSKKRENPKD
jgi:inner membrane protein